MYNKIRPNVPQANDWLSIALLLCVAHVTQRGAHFVHFSLIFMAFFGALERHSRYMRCAYQSKFGITSLFMKFIAAPVRRHYYCFFVSWNLRFENAKKKLSAAAK